MDAIRFSAITSPTFQRQKFVVLICRELFAQFNLPSHDRQKLLELLETDDLKAAEAILLAQPSMEGGKKTTLMTLPIKAIGWLTGTGMSEPINVARRAIQQIDDTAYVADLDNIAKQEPLLAKYTERSLEHLYTYLAGQVKEIGVKLRERVKSIQLNTCEQTLSREFRIRETQARKRFRIQLLEELNSVFVNNNACACLFMINNPYSLARNIEHPLSFSKMLSGFLIASTVVGSLSQFSYQTFSQTSFKATLPTKFAASITSKSIPSYATRFILCVYQSMTSIRCKWTPSIFLHHPLPNGSQRISTSPLDMQ